MPGRVIPEREMVGVRLLLSFNTDVAPIRWMTATDPKPKFAELLAVAF